MSHDPARLRPDTPRCPKCDRRWRRVYAPSFYGAAFLGFYPADVCPAGHLYWTEASSRAGDILLKELGLWGRPPPRVWPRPRSRLAARSKRTRHR